MYAVSDAFLSALRASHRVAFRVDAYRAGARIASDLPISGGSVAVDAGSQVRRSLDLTIADPSLMPGDEDDVLAPYGTELYVNRGVTFPNGVIEWCPVGVFRVDDVSAAVGGSAVTVKAPDRAMAVADARFRLPRSADTSQTRPQMITTLLQEAIPGLVVHNLSTSTSLLRKTVWERDRWEAINAMAASIGCEVFFDARGDGVIRPEPSIVDPVAWFVDAGESGVMVTGERQLTREMTYNVVVALGERTDNSPPIYGIAEDTDPASPTRVGGPYGEVTRFYASPLLNNTSEAEKAAQTILDKVRSLTRQVSLDAVPNPALEPGDVIEVRFPDGAVERHIIDALSIPLGVDSAMSLTTRTSRPELE